MDPHRDERPTDFDGLGAFSLDQDWALKRWIDLSPPAPGRSGFHVAPHLYLGALRWRGQWSPGASGGTTRDALDGDGTWSWAPATGVGVSAGYQRLSVRGRIELSRRSLDGQHLLHQAANLDLLAQL
ncbi:MAG: hypothetical protein ACI9VR_001542 [Cognaticolwellia sp.]|jgi:hypothetical protein